MSKISSEPSLELNRHIVNLLDMLSALYGVTEISIRYISEAELLKQALEALMQNQDMERCSIFLLDQHHVLYNAAGRDWNDLLSEFTHVTRPQSATHRKNTFALGEGLMGRAAESEKIEHCKSVIDEPQFKYLGSERENVQGSIICVPIKSEGEVLGVLNVSYPEDNFFNVWHERLLQLFCQMVGRVIDNHRLFYHMDSLVNQRTNELRTVNSRLQEEIKERDKMQLALKQQHSFLKSMIDANVEPMMVIGKDYKIQYMSQSAMAASGIESNPTDSFCYQISHHRDSPCEGKEHPCPLNMVIKTGKMATVTHRHYKVDGALCDVELIASPFISSKGEIVGIIESARDVTERLNNERRLHQRHKQFKHQAYHDHLTGLPNRLLFNNELERITTESERDNRKMALLFLDLDGFKPVNDQYGHDVGDELLQIVASRIQSNIRNNDIAARIAGDEFAVLLVNLGMPEDAGVAADKLVSLISKPYHLNQVKISISVSIGIALYPKDCNVPDKLITCADEAMYRAKKNGKGNYSYYSVSGNC